MNSTEPNHIQPTHLVSEGRSPDRDILIQVNADLTLHYGTIHQREGIHATVEAPQQTLLGQLVAYLRLPKSAIASSDSPQRLTSSSVSSFSFAYFYPIPPQLPNVTLSK